MFHVFRNVLRAAPHRTVLVADFIAPETQATLAADHEPRSEHSLLAIFSIILPKTLRRQSFTPGVFHREPFAFLTRAGFRAHRSGISGLFQGTTLVQSVTALVWRPCFLIRLDLHLRQKSTDAAWNGTHLAQLCAALQLLQF